MISENPYKIDQTLITDDGRIRRKVLAVIGHMVFLSGQTFEEYGIRFHWKEVQNCSTLEPTKGWECLTAENWKASRDKMVWVRDNGAAFPHQYKLLSYEPDNRFPFIAVRKDDAILRYKEVSIYNEDGVEAK